MPCSPRCAVTRLAALLATSAAAGCLAPSLDVMPRVISLDVDGTYSSSDGSIPTGPNDFSDLGLSDDQVEFSPRVDLRSGRWDVTADWIGSDVSGTGQLANGLVIDGVAFAAGNSVASDLEFRLARLGATWDFVKDPGVVVGLGAGIGVWETEAFLLDLDTSAQSESDKLGVAPHLMARLGHEFGDFDVQLLVGFLDFEINDVESTYVDADGFVRWRFRGREQGWSGALLLGYRFIEVDTSYNDEVQDENVDSKIQLHGPYLGVSLGF